MSIDVKVAHDKISSSTTAEEQILSEIKKEFDSIKKLFLGRIGATQEKDPKAIITEKLFAHIHNDATIKGTAFQGNIFSESIRYISACLQNFPLEDKNNVEEYKILKTLIDKFNRFHSINTQVENLIDAAINEIQETVKKSCPESEDRTISFIDSKLVEEIKNIEITYSKRAVDVILDDLLRNKSLIIEGGWANAISGHAMLYDLERASSDDHYLLSIFNSGAGLKFHDKEYGIEKNKYYPVWKIQIHKDNTELLKKYLVQLIRARIFHQYSENKYYSQKNLYDILFEFISNDGCKLLLLPSNPNYITGQRSSCCTVKVQMVYIKDFIKNKLPKYSLQGGYFIKTQSLLDFYDLSLKEGKLSDPITAQQFKDAISNLARLILKMKKTNPTINVNDSDSILVLCEHIEKSIEKLKSTGVNPCYPVLISDLIHYKPTKIAQIPFQQTHDVLIPESTTFNGIDPSRKTDYEYSLKSPLNFVSPMVDLKTLESDITKLLHNHDSHIYIMKRIEAFFIYYPLELQSYWAELKKAEVLEILKSLNNIIYTYVSRLYVQQNIHAERIITEMSLLCFHIKLGEYYFSDICRETQTSLYNKIKERLVVLDDYITNHPALYFDNPVLDRRNSEIRRILFDPKIRMETVTNSTAIKEISLSSIARFHKFNPSENKKLLEEVNKAFDLEKQLNPSLLKIENETEFQMSIALKNHKDLLPAVLLDDCRIYLHWFSLYANINTLCNYNSLGRIECFDYKITDDIVFPGQFVQAKSISTETQTEGKFFYKSEPEFDSNSISYLSEKINGINPSFERGSVFSYHVFTTHRYYTAENAEQTKSIFANSNTILHRTTRNRETLCNVTDDLRQILHTRSLDNNHHSRISATLEYFLSHLDKLCKIDYQVLLTINLFNNGILDRELKINPRILYSLFDFIEKGIAYYREDKQISKTLPFFLKLNAFLLNYITDSQLKVSAEIIQIASNIEQRVYDFLRINEPKIKIDASKQSIIETTITQRRLYLILLQKIERQLKQFLKNELTLNQKDLIKDFLSAIFYIYRHNISSKKEEDQSDPIYQNIQNNILYYITPLMSSFLNALIKEKGIEALLDLLPNEIIKELDPKSLHYQFPFIVGMTINQEECQLNLSKGQYLKKGRSLLAFPESARENVFFKRTFGDIHIHEALVDTIKMHTLFQFQGNNYNISGDGITDPLSKEIIINSQTYWYNSIGLHMAIGESFLYYAPKWLTDQSFSYWYNPKIGMVIASKTSGENLYYCTIDSSKNVFKEIYKLNKGHTVSKLVNFYKPFYHFDKHPIKNPFQFLEKFESPAFLQIFRTLKTNSTDTRKDLELTINLPRYGLNFSKEMAQSSDELVWQQDKRFALDLSQKAPPIKSFLNYLRLKSIDARAKLKDCLLIPFQPFVTVNKHHFELDTSGLYLRHVSSGRFLKPYQRGRVTSVPLNKGTSFDPTEWNITNTCHYIRYNMSKSGNISCESASDCLFLAYIYIAVNDSEQAFKYLDQFQKMGGFSGTKHEAAILSWLLNGIPYQLFLIPSENEPEITSAEKDSMISTPDLTAFRLKVIYLYLIFVNSQRNFILNDPAKDTINSSYIKTENKKLRSFFITENISEITKSLLNEYQGAKNNIPYNRKLTHKELSQLFYFLELQRIGFRPNLERERRKALITSLHMRERIEDLRHLEFLPAPSITRTVMQEKDFLLKFEMNKESAEAIQKFIKSDPRSFDLKTLLKLDQFSKELIEIFEMPIRTMNSLNEEQKNILLKQTLVKIKNHIQKQALKDGGSKINFIEQFELICKINDGVFKDEQIALLLFASIHYALKFPKHFGSTDRNKDNAVAEFLIKASEVSMKHTVIIRYASRGIEEIETNSVSKIYPENLPALKPYKSIEVGLELVNGLPNKNQILAKYNLAAIHNTTGKTFDNTQTTLKSLGTIGIDTKTKLDKHEERDLEIGRSQNIAEQLLKQLLSENLLKDSTILPKVANDIKNALDNAKSKMQELELKLMDYKNLLPKIETLARTIPEFRKKEILALVLTQNSHYYHDHLPAFRDDQIKALYKISHQYIQAFVHYQHYKRLSSFLDKIKGSNDPENSLQNLKNQLIADPFRNALSPNIQYLFFEYINNILMRKDQVDVLKMLLKSASPSSEILSNTVVQYPMGAGKTSVNSPNVIYQMATGSNLVMVILPPPLVEACYRDLASVSISTFNQMPIRLPFHRGIAFTENNMAQILQLIRNTIMNKEFLVATQIETSSMELLWLDRLGRFFSENRNKNCDINIPISIRFLELALTFLREKADVIIDEIDTVQDPRKELNFGASPEISLDIETLNRFIEFYFEILDVKFEFNNAIFSVLDVLEGKLPTLTETIWKKLFTEVISEKIIENALNNISSPLHTIFNKYCKEKAELKAYLRNKAKAPAFVKELNPSEKEIIGLYKGQASELLEYTLPLVPFLNYGYSKKVVSSDENFIAVKCVAIPYEGVNLPSERSKFGPFVSINGTIQLNLLFGIEKFVLKDFVQQFKREAIRQRSASGGIYKTLLETPASIEFFKITGLNEKEFNLNNLNPMDDEDIEKIYHQLVPKNNIKPKTVLEPEKVSLAKRPSLIKYCLSHFILKEIKMTEKILRHDAQNQTGVFRSLRGYSGTILSPFFFDNRISFDYQSSLGTDGQIIDTLIRKNTKVMKVSKTDPKERLMELLNAGDDKLRAIIDEGAHFKGFGLENENIAKLIADFYLKVNTNVRFVLYFNSENRLCVIHIKEKKPIIIGGTNIKLLKSCIENWDPSICFTFYDQAHTTGTNIIHMENAKAFVTLSSKSKRKDVLQAAARMRDLAGSHSVEVVIGPELIEAFPEKKLNDIDIKGLLDITRNIQDLHVENGIYPVASQKIANLFRNFFATRLLKEKDFTKKEQLFFAIEPLLYAREKTSLFETFSEVDEENTIDKLLDNEIISHIKKFKEYISNADIDINDKEVSDSFKKIWNDAIKIKKQAATLCQIKVRKKSTHVDARIETIRDITQNTPEMDVENEHINKADATKKHAYQRVSTTVQVERLTENNTTSDRKVEIENRQERELQRFSHPFDFDENHPVAIEKDDILFWRLDEAFDQKNINADWIPNFKFSKNLYISHNFITALENHSSVFGSYQRPIFTVLFLQNSKTSKMKACILTQSEAAQYRGKGRFILEQDLGCCITLSSKIPDNVEAKKLWNAWMLTPRGIFYDSTGLEAYKAKTEYSSTIGFATTATTAVRPYGPTAAHVTPANFATTAVLIPPPTADTSPAAKFSEAFPEIMTGVNIAEQNLLLEQVHYINADTDILLQNFSNLKWLLKDLEKKIAFYERVILTSHPAKAENYGFLKRKFDQYLEEMRATRAPVKPLLFTTDVKGMEKATKQKSKVIEPDTNHDHNDNRNPIVYPTAHAAADAVKRSRS